MAFSKKLELIKLKTSFKLNNFRFSENFIKCILWQLVLYILKIFNINTTMILEFWIIGFTKQVTSITYNKLLLTWVFLCWHLQGESIWQQWRTHSFLRTFWHGHWGEAVIEPQTFSTAGSQLLHLLDYSLLWKMKICRNRRPPLKTLHPKQNVI